MHATTRLLILAAVLIFSLSACDRPPEGSLIRAEEFWAKRDYRSAVIELKSLLKNEPNNAQARWVLGQIYVEMEDGPSAEKELLRASSLGVVDDSVTPALARAFLLQNKVDDVLDLQPRSTMSSLSTAELQAARALAYAAKKEFDEANLLMDAARAAALNSPWVRLSHARLLISTDKLDEAKQALTSLLAEEPANGEAWSLLAGILEAENAYSEADTAYSNAIEYRFSQLSDRLRRGLLRLAKGDLAGATEDADLLLKRSPNSPIVQYLTGAVRFQQKDYPQAEVALEAAFTKNDRHVQTTILLATTHALLGNRTRAQHMAERAVSLAPGLIPARKLLAVMRLEEGDGEEADRLLRPVVEARPDDLEAKDLLATSLIEQGKAAEAVLLFEELAVKRKDQAVAQLRAGIALLSAKEDRRGLELMRKAGELAPSELRIHTLIVNNLVRAKHTDAALAKAKTYADLHPEDPIAWKLLGAVYFANGDLMLGRQAFERALQLNPGDPQASEKLALLALHNSNYEAAREVLTSALEMHPDNSTLLYRLAIVELSDEKLGFARELLERAITAAPSVLEPRLALAQILIDQGEPIRAMGLISDPAYVGNPGVLQIKAAAYLQLGQFEEAKLMLEMLRALAPESLAVNFSLARVYSELKDNKQLKDTLDRVLELAPESKQALFAKARILTAEKRYDEAEKILGQLNLPAENPTLLSERIFIERARGDWIAAIQTARLWFDTLPSTTSLLALSAAQIQAGDLAAAEAALSGWVAENPRDVVAMRVLSQLYIRTDDREAAIRVLEKLVAVSPQDAKAHNNLAWYLREIDPARALTHAKIAYGLAPNLTDVLDTYADTLARNGHTAPALAAIGRAVAMNNGNPMLKLRRAEIKKLCGDRDQAAKELNALLGAEEVPEVVKDRARSLLAAWSKSR